MSSVKEISAPSIFGPVYSGGGIIGYERCAAGNKVSVFANGNELIGEGIVWPLGWGPVKLIRPLKEGDVVTAIQSKGDESSYPTWPEHAKTAVKIPKEKLINNETLFPPKVDPPLYHCQKAIKVVDTMEGAKINYEISAGIHGSGEVWTPYGSGYIVRDDELVENQVVHAKQHMEWKRDSEYSADEKVQSKPSTLPVPEIIGNPCIGASLVAVGNLVRGASVTISYIDSDTGEQTDIGGGIAIENKQAFSIRPIERKGKLIASQALCEIKTVSSPTDTKDFIAKPEIEQPICPDAVEITVHNTELGAIVQLKVNNEVRGYATAPGETTTINLGGNESLKEGEEVSVLQYILDVSSGWTDAIKVSGPSSDPIVTIENGNPFFNPAGDEKLIPGPVFLRGSHTAGSFGPVFKTTMCGTKKAIVHIIDPNGEKIETIELSKVKAGHFIGGWDWTHASWKIPSDIPVGEYKAQFEVYDANQVYKKQLIFYVIFNPSEVNAHEAFSISDKGRKGIYFGSGFGWDRANVFELHLSDKRVFLLALKGKNFDGIPDNIKNKVVDPGINGETDPYTAAIKLLKMESDLFDYSVSDTYPKNDDVTYLMENAGKVQCYHDSNVLVALLRSVGIPARPVTGDAASEYQHTWVFDTWVEARLRSISGEDWFVLYPHLRSGYIGPLTRTEAAEKIGVVSRNDNDIIISANGNWIPEEVSDWGYDMEFSYKKCGENVPAQPNKEMNKQASWIDHLCEEYWKPDTHWDCLSRLSFRGHGVYQEPLPERSSIELSFSNKKYVVGEDISITAAINNLTDDRLTDDINLELVVRHLWNMAGEDILYRFNERLSIEPNKSEIIKTSFPLKLNLNDTDIYFIRASYSKNQALKKLSITPRFDARAVFPSGVKEGDEFKIELILTNTTNSVLNDIYVKINAPFEIKVGDPLDLYVKEIKPDETKKFVWNCKALSYTVVGIFKINVSTTDGGETIITKGMSIERLAAYENKLPVVYIPIGSRI